MERAAHRKSRSASGIDGIKPNPRNKSISRSSLDSRAYIDGTARDSMFVLEFGQSSAKRTAETPRKKLLDQELPKEVNPKKRSPGVIAKLMGLEGFPSPRHVQIPQKRLSESPQPKTFSIKTPKSSLVEHQEFKDVYEDMESSNVFSRRCSSRWSADSMLTKSEMARIQQNLAEARYVSTRKNVQQLKAGDETFGVINSSEAVLLKHLHDLQARPFDSLRGTSSPSDCAKYDSHAKTRKSGAEVAGKQGICSHVKREDGLLLDPLNRHRSNVIHRSSSKAQLEEKHEKKNLPTRIVVLKPNAGKVPSSGATLSPSNRSGDSNLGYMKQCIGGAETATDISKYSYSSGLTKSLSQEVRNKALEITRRMRDGFDCDKLALMSSNFRGYAGDESSFDAFESDSGSESEMFKLHSRNSFDSNLKYPSYYLVESPAEREAKYRLSERWKRSNRYQDAHTIWNDGTLGEMLGKREKEPKSVCLNSKTSVGRPCDSLNGSKTNISKWGDPVGISRNNRKDKKSKSSCNPKFHPPSINGRSRNSDVDARPKDSNPGRNDPTIQRDRILKENRSEGEVISSKYSNSGSKKSVHGRKKNHLDYSSDVSVEIQSEAKVVKIEKKLHEQKKLCPIAFSNDTGVIPESNISKAADSGSSILPLISSEEFHEQEPMIVYQELPKGPSEEGSPSLQFLGTDPDSSESSKETDHLSPVSVLEVPFTEDAASGSESFARVDAGLRELRMQLKLLKIESGTYAGEETAPQSPSGSDRNDTIDANDWEASYVLDALIASGFEEHGLDSFQPWHSPECPLDPEMFNILEKKYCDESTLMASKSDRMMLFDRINSAISVISQQYANTRPWAVPKISGLDSKSQNEDLRYVFEKLVWQDYSNEEISEEELDKETHWFNANTEADFIALEMEEILLDEMISEAICK